MYFFFSFINYVKELNIAFNNVEKQVLMVANCFRRL